MNSQELISHYEKGMTRREMLFEQRSSRLVTLDKLTKRQVTLSLAQAFIQEIAKQTQETLQYHIKDIAQSAIDSVFPGKYTLMVDFNTKRGSTECDIYLDKDGHRLDPVDSNGGGLLDIVSTALRIAAWSLGRTDNVLMLDEPFKQLSAKYKPVFADIVRKLSRQLKLQLIVVTHDTELINVADRVFKVDQRMKKSSVEVL